MQQLQAKAEKLISQINLQVTEQNKVEAVKATLETRLKTFENELSIINVNLEETKKNQNNCANKIKEFKKVLAKYELERQAAQEKEKEAADAVNKQLAQVAAAETRLQNCIQAEVNAYRELQAAEIKFKENQYYLDRQEIALRNAEMDLESYEIYAKKYPDKANENRLAAKQRTVDRCRKNVSMAQRKLYESENNRNRKHQVYQTASANQETADKNLQKERQTLATKQTILVYQKLEVEKRTKSVTDQQKAINDAEIQYQQLSEQVTKIEEFRKNKIKDIEINKLEIIDAQKKLNSIKNKLEELKTEQTENANQRKTTSNELIKLKEECQRKLNECDKQRQDIEENKKKRNLSKKSIKDKRTQMQQTQQEILSKKSEQNVLEENLKNNQEQLELANKSIVEHKSNIREQQNKKKRVEQEKSKYEQNLQKSKTKIEKYENDIERLEHHQRQLDRDLNNKQRDIIEKQNQCQEIKHNLDQHQRTISTKKSNISQLTQKQTSLNSNLTKNKNEIKRLDTKIKDLSKDIDKQNNLKQNVEQQVNEVRSNVKILKKDFERLDNNYSKIEQRHNESSNRYRNTNNNLIEARNKKSSTKNNLIAKQSYIDARKAKYYYIDHQIASKNTEISEYKMRQRQAKQENKDIQRNYESNRNIRLNTATH